MIIDKSPRFRINSHWTILLLFCFFYYIVNFVLTPNDFFPVHQDDYILLGRGFQDMALLIERPVTLNIAYLVSEFGMLPPFILVSALVVIVPMLIVLFLEKLFDIRFRWYSLVLFSAIIFGHFSAFENGKYLGSVVGMSGLLGSLTLLIMILAFKKNEWKYVLMALIGYALTCFSREDFLLPPLILLILFYLNTYLKSEKKLTQETILIYRRTIIASGIIMLIIASLSVLLSIKVGSRFANMFSASSVAVDPYAVKLTFNSLVSSFHQLSIEFIPAPTIFFLIGITIVWFTHRDKRLELIAVAFIVISILLPYAMIPNNLPAYRVVSWLPWFAAIGCIATQAVICKLREQLGVAVAVVGVSMIIGTSFYVLLQYDLERKGIAAWYTGQQILNKNIIGTLQQNRGSISKEDIVAIQGIEGLSPWGNTDAQFLRNKLGFQNKWILFVGGSNAFNTVNYNDDAGSLHAMDQRQHVFVAPLSMMCDMPDMLIIVFDGNGLGEPRHTNQLCNK